MLVAIAFARPVAAADSRGAGLAATPIAEWLAEPGRPGWLADDALGTALPPAIAGLIAGGVAVRDPFAPIALPWPGIAEAQVPLAWYDSSAVVIGEDAAWRGFGAALEEARGFASPPSDRRARAVATVIQGTSAMDRNGLLVSRGDAHAWLRAGAVGDRRGGAGALGPAADHVWLAQGGLTRGQHHWRASYAQRGEGAEQTTGFRDGGHGEDAELAWQWSGRHGTLGATITRGTDIRDSDEPGAALDLGAHRAAQQTGVAVEAARGDSAHRDGVRLELADAHVTRLEASPVFRPEPAVAWAERSAWLAARAQRPLGGGALELALGGGHAGAPAAAAERWQLAPSAVWRMARPGAHARLFAERLVTPVWSDLADGVAPFVQDAWVGGFDAGFGDHRTRWFDVGVLGGRAAARALLHREPVGDFTLRFGWRPDERAGRFTLATVEAGARGHGLGVDASGYALARERSALEPQVDPALGARAGAEVRFRLFTGDLAVRLRLEAAYVGSRQDDPVVATRSGPVELPAYVTLAGTLALGLGDVTLAVRGLDLEDQETQVSWTDLSATGGGAPAGAARRQLRLEITWPFLN